MKTKKRVYVLLSIWMCTVGAAFADGAPEERVPGEKKGDAIITIFSDAHSGLVLSMMTEGLIWTVPILAISMPCLTDCS